MAHNLLKQTFVGTYTTSLGFLPQLGWQGPFVINSGFVIRWVRGCLALEVRMDPRDWGIGEYLCRLPDADEPDVWAVNQAGKTVRVHLMDFLTEQEQSDEEVQLCWTKYKALFRRRSRKETLERMYTVDGFSEICERRSELVGAVLRRYGCAIFNRAHQMFGCS
jgi:hypothetical protein